jgi:hypothetical protein
MRKNGLNKLKKFGLLGILMLLISVIALTYKSMNREINQGNDMVESTAQEEMPMTNKVVEEKMGHEGMNMKGNKEMEIPQSPEGYTGVQITPERQQLIGVKTDEVITRNLIRDIRTVGIIEADETKIARISIKFTDGLMMCL